MRYGLPYKGSKNAIAEWIPTECGVKCSECGTEYADTDYPEKMHQCPHCYSQMGEPRKLTNGDKIRAMTDEELAEFFDKISDCQTCIDYPSKCHVNCIDSRLKWLQKEAE